MPLTPANVRLILTSPEPGAALARQLDATKQAVSQVRRGITHRNLFPDLPRRARKAASDRYCHDCRHWRGGSDPCSQGIPDPIEEGPFFAADCDHYEPRAG
jgi:hypothetical protein